MFAAGEPIDIMWSQYLKKISRAGQRSPDLEESISALLKDIPANSNMFERVVLFMAHDGMYSNEIFRNCTFDSYGATVNAFNFGSVYKLLFLA